MSFNDYFYCTQEHLYSNDYLQPEVSPYNFNTLLLDDNSMISTPQLYYSPIPTEEFPEQPSMLQQWADPPINHFIDTEQPCLFNYQDPCLLDQELFMNSYDPCSLNQQDLILGHKKRNETPLEEKKYTCPVCNHKSKRRHNMVEHMQTHNPNRPKAYSCQICLRAFARKYDMKRHEKIHYRK